MQRLQITTFLPLFAICLLLFGRDWLYFQYHCSDAPTLAVLRGVRELETQSLAALDGSQFLMRSADQGVCPNGSIDLPVHEHLRSLGWEFEEQMGAGLHYRRGEQWTSALLTTVGRDYWLVTFYCDLESGHEIQRKRPFNLFGSP